MKSFVKELLRKSVQRDWVWKSLNATLIPLAHYAEDARNGQLQTPIPDVVTSIFNDKTVKHGVFAGMKYPEYRSAGSTFYPKLLGSYERELEPLLEHICSTNYTEIVDIGCAEGYYAIGLAMRINTARVFAFDTNAEAIRLCEEMARLNCVSERLTTGAFCNSATLKNLPLTKKALIVSDCEGYERHLFTKDTAAFLSQHDLLIEVHDLIDIEISSYLRRVFESTHSIEVFSALDDIKKAQMYDYEEIQGCSLAIKKQILSEGRKAMMEWFFLTPHAR